MLILHTFKVNISPTIRAQENDGNRDTPGVSLDYSKLSNTIRRIFLHSHYYLNVCSNTLPHFNVHEVLCEKIQCSFIVFVVVMFYVYLFVIVFLLEL